ncbi:MAG: hypothetical protein IPF42_02825 [Candidatus Microthrix sp.]|nr:hypothetical protein [Candidatus Microthrix sp.]
MTTNTRTGAMNWRSRTPYKRRGVAVVLAVQFLLGAWIRVQLVTRATESYYALRLPAAA